MLLTKCWPSHFHTFNTPMIYCQHDEMSQNIIESVAHSILRFQKAMDIFKKIVICKKSIFEKKTFFACVSRLMNFDFFYMLLLWKGPLRLVDNVEYTQKLLRTSRSEKIWKTVVGGKNPPFFPPTKDFTSTFDKIRLSWYLSKPIKDSVFSSHLVNIFMSFQNIENQGGRSVRKSCD